MSASSTAQRPRATRQRAAVADILARTDEFRSAQQIHSALEAEGTKVGLATVYRNLQTLAESGAVDQVRSAGGFRRRAGGVDSAGLSAAGLHPDGAHGRVLRPVRHVLGPGRLTGLSRSD